MEHIFEHLERLSEAIAEQNNFDIEEPSDDHNGYTYSTSPVEMALNLQDSMRTLRRDIEIQHTIPSTDDMIRELMDVVNAYVPQTVAPSEIFDDRTGQIYNGTPQRFFEGIFNRMISNRYEEPDDDPMTDILDAFFRNQEPQTEKLTDIQFNELKTVAIGKMEMGVLEKGDPCSICMDNYEELQKVTYLPCGHYFHTDCIRSWLTKGNVTCPLCKHDAREKMKSS